MSTDRLHNMIDRYFSGDLDVKEERILLECLLSLEEKDDRAEEALAVMSWARLQPKSNKAKRSGDVKTKQSGINASFFRIATSAAAAIALAVGVTAYLHNTRTSHPDCYAYINGTYIHNPEEVNAMIGIQLEEMSVASHETAIQAMSELEEMRMALDGATSGLQDDKEF